MKPPQTDAFTLLELMIALAIAGTLAAFALPSYWHQIARSHRMDAASALYRAAQFVEAAASDAQAALPAGLDRTPQAGAPIYRLQVLPGSDANGGYSVEAVPDASGPMRDDPCGVFTLDATGQRGNRNGAGYASLSTQESTECWNGN